MHWILKKQTWRWTVLAVSPLIVFYFLWSVRAVLYPFGLAILLAYLLGPLVFLLEQRGLSRFLAILFVYTALITATTLVVIFGYPRLIRELTLLNEQVPVYTAEIQSILQHFQDNYSSFDLPESVRQVIDRRIAELEKLILTLVHRSVDLLISLLSQVISFLLAPVLAFYFLKDRDIIRSTFTSLIPQKVKVDVFDLVRDIDTIVRRFIRGHLLVCSLVGGLTTLGMYLIGMPFALLLGLFAGIADLIPFFGPFLGAVPAVVLSLVQSWHLTVYVIIIFFVVQQFEANIISPKIMGAALGLHPVVVIFALLAGGQLWGIAGMLAALPAAAILKVVGRYIFLKLVG